MSDLEKRVKVLEAALIRAHREAIQREFRLRAQIDFWRNNQNDPHGIGYAVLAALESVQNCIVFKDK